MAKKKSKAKKRRGFGRFLSILIILCTLAGLARLLVFEPVKITSDAMAPAYRRGDVVSLIKHDVIFANNVRRGDVVRAFFDAGDVRLIRRICGVPGDLIEVREDGSKYLVYTDDGGVLREKALGDAPALVHGTIPEGAYLLLNDQTEADAEDGRNLGLVYIADITAKAGAILWPPSRMFR